MNTSFKLETCDTKKTMAELEKQVFLFFLIIFLFPQLSSLKLKLKIRGHTENMLLADGGYGNDESIFSLGQV